MTIIYDDLNKAPFTGRFNYENANANKYWAEHYSNWKYLHFIATNKLATFQERQQAEKELVIAERKINYWQRHQNFMTEVAIADKRRIDDMWKGEPV